MEKLRLDKWLWAARFYKTRSLAVDDITKGRVLINGQRSKPARELNVGDVVTLHKNTPAMVVEVVKLSTVRGPAPIAQTLYAETAESILAREQAREQRRLAPEPAHSIHAGRPTKRDRRQLQRIWDS